MRSSSGFVPPAVALAAAMATTPAALSCDGAAQTGSGTARRSAVGRAQPHRVGVRAATTPRGRPRVRPGHPPRPPRRALAAPTRPVLRLEVAGDVARHLVPVTKRRYEEAELTGLFAQLRRLGDPFCAMVWKQRPWKRKVALQFVTKRKLRSYHCGGCRRSFITGCWNFFIMNDRRPDREFRLVKHLYGAQAPFDCYSVSFLQPYMMHAQLGCRSLTLLDLDWRIMDGHLQLLRKVRAGGARTVADAERVVRSLDLGWVAYSKRMQPREPVELDWFCGNAQVPGQRQLCRTYLPAFARRFAELREVRLQAMPLHEASYDTDRTKRTKVVFLSNALDIVYTRWWEFLKLMRRARASLAVGGKMVLIHHISGHRGFMIYELERLAKGHRLRAVCRDRHRLTGRSRAKFIKFQSHAPNKKGNLVRIPHNPTTPEHAAYFKDLDPVEVYTHLDVIARGRRSAPRCATLLARHERRARKP